MRALILSGGGSKGAYQAGAVSFLVKEMGVRYDAYCGVSVGAINAAHLAQYGDDSAELAVDTLLEFWKGINSDSVYRSWFFGKLAALWKPSVYNSEPLRQYLEERLDVGLLNSSGKKLRIGAVSMDSGVYETFSGTDVAILDALVASSAYPVMFLPVSMNGEMWSDGGIRNVTPLREAFCLGADSADVIMCQPPERRFSPLDKPNAIKNLERMLDIMLEEVIETDLKLALAYNRIADLDPDSGRKHINIRVLRPSSNLPGSSLDFDHHIEERISLGWEDARKAFG